MTTFTSEQDWNKGINKFHESHLIRPNTTRRPDDLIWARGKHLKKALNRVEIDGAFLEFGVHSGTTINTIASHKIAKDKTIHGFDSFEGLPEDWFTDNTHKTKYKKGYFARDELPKVEKNVKLWKGWFTDTIPQYLEEHQEQIAFLHIDSDLYSSAIDVLYGLKDYIVEGTIIVFDEFYPWGRKKYELWERGEYKALREWAIEFDRHLEVLYHSSHQQTSIKILK